jgi:predicted DNA-binding transcriptional regulator AlpA
MWQAAVITAETAPLPWYPSREQGGAVAAQGDDTYLDTEAVAQHVGLTTESVRVYLKRSRRRVASGQPLRPQDLPLPDITIGRSPAWRQSTIDEWDSHRTGPGRPAGSG